MIMKFRAWDKISKCMCDVDSINLYDEFYEYKFFGKDKSISGVADFNDKSVILMQSTWMRDKNYKEIFEGDIVKPVGFASWIGVVAYSKENAAYILDSHDNDFVRDTNVYLSQFAEGLEVKGNIYENPELMEKQGE